MARKKDTQKNRLYRAEDIFKHNPDAIADSQAFVDNILLTPWWIERSNVTKVNVRAEGWCGIRYAYVRRDGTQWNMVLPNWARCEYVILHELAHILNDSDPLRAFRRSHGTFFASCLLDMVARYVSTEMAEKLKARFNAYRVQYKRPKRDPRLPDARFVKMPRSRWDPEYVPMVNYSYSAPYQFDRAKEENHDFAIAWRTALCAEVDQDGNYDALQTRYAWFWMNARKTTAVRVRCFYTHKHHARPVYLICSDLKYHGTANNFGLSPVVPWEQ